MPSAGAVAWRSASSSRKRASMTGGLPGSRPLRWTELVVAGRIWYPRKLTPECFASFRGVVPLASSAIGAKRPWMSGRSRSGEDLNWQTRSCPLVAMGPLRVTRYLTPCQPCLGRVLKCWVGPRFPLTLDLNAHSALFDDPLSHVGGVNTQVHAGPAQQGVRIGAAVL